MPLYSYRNPKTGAIIEELQPMDAPHEYTDEKGIEYERVFSLPNLSKDNDLDAFNEKDFARKTRDKNYNLGEMWDLSKKLSEKRKSKAGKDEVKEKNLIKKYDRRARNIKKNPSKKLPD